MGGKSSKHTSTWDLLQTAKADKEFFRSLQTGDIVLACTATPQASCMRGMLGEHMHRTRWDHVFIVIRRDYERSSEPVPKHKIRSKTKCDPRYCSCTRTWIDTEDDEDDFCLEVCDATTTGLHIFNMKGRLARLSHYFSHLAIRRLRGPRPPDKLAQLEKFLLSVRGMGYRMGVSSFCSLLCHCASHHASKEHNARASTDGWFCAEIVTRSLMEIGALEPDTSQDSFLPSDFSTLEEERGELKDVLADGYSFGPELLIMWPGNELQKELHDLKSKMKQKQKIISADTQVHRQRLRKEAKVAPMPMS